MKQKMDVKSVALTVGATFGVLHALGVLGMQVGLMRYWMWAHLVSFQYEVRAFSLVAFIVGIVVASVVGAGVGWLFASVYNALAR